MTPRRIATPLRDEDGLQRVERLRSVLATYMAPIIATGVVKAALKNLSLREEECVGERFEQLVGHCRTGLSLFVKGDRLPELMLALADLIEQHDDEPAPPSRHRLGSWPEEPPTARPRLGSWPEDPPTSRRPAGEPPPPRSARRPR